MPEDIHAWVGYERRLYKMRRPELLAEADRVGVSLKGNQEFILLSDLIKLILKAQGINDQVLINPPPPRKKKGK